MGPRNTQETDGQAVPYTKQYLQGSTRHSQNTQKDDILPISPVCFPLCLALKDMGPVEFMGRTVQEGGEGMKAQEPEQKRPVSTEARMLWAH